MNNVNISNKMRLIGTIIFLSMIITTGALAQDINTLRKLHFNLEGKMALQQYDPVAYFTQGKAVKGLSELSYNYGNAVYYFSSVGNMALFKANPAQYEPQFGGWCAYAMGAKGEKVNIDPKTFKIIQGKLYLFYNSLFNNTLKTWNTDETNLLRKANQHWTKTFK